MLCVHVSEILLIVHVVVCDGGRERDREGESGMWGEGRDIPLAIDYTELQGVTC